MRPALPGSYEALFHQFPTPDFWIPLRGNAAASAALSEERLERAIGVIYMPQTERVSHYFHVSLPVSSTPSFITTSRARSSCWSAGPSSTPQKRRKRTPARCETRAGAIQ